MSIQSDVEMLSIEALEYYAHAHELSAKETVHLFHKYQVFEKIILQHEYLHQLDVSETLAFVEEIIAQGSSTLILYHGTNIAFDQIDLSKSHNRRDFGRGFYCTILESQAIEWAHRLYMRKLFGGEYVKTEEAVDRLRYSKVNNQVSFHIPKALKHLTFETRKEVKS